MKNERFLLRRTFSIRSRAVLPSLATFSYLVFLSLVQKALSSSCQEQNLPITVGGSRDDKANCIVYDPTTKLIITGGTTRSSDFGPANTNYGFLYAINLNGDWVWGNYFINQTENFQEVTACKMSSNGRQVVILGTTQSQVAMAIVNATTGKITNLYSLEDKASVGFTDQKPSYETYGAILLDNEDIGDGKAYLYTSFMMDGTQQLVRLRQAIPDKSRDFPEIKYHYSFVSDKVSENDDPQTAALKRLIPQNMFTMDSSRGDQDSFYISGTYKGFASIMKFYKRNAQLRWHAQMNSFTSIDAIAVHENPAIQRAHFFGCGRDNQQARGVQADERPFENQAWIFSMDEDGEANWMIKLGGQSLSEPQNLSDSCQGIVYDAIEDRIVALVETNSPQLRVDRDNQQKDSLLVEINKNGRISRAVAFSLGNSLYDMLGYAQNLVKAGDQYYQSGQLYGFQTIKQTQFYQSLRSRNLDNFLFPLKFEDKATEKCIYDRDIQGSQLTPFANFSNNLRSRDLYSLLKSSNRDVPKQTQGDQMYRVNYSKFVMSSPLRSFIKTPRPCAYQSLMLNDEPKEYYRASQALIFFIADETPYGKVISQMNPRGGGTSTIIDSTGEVAQGAAFSAEDGGKIGFFAQAVSSIGLNELTLRHCDRLQRLFDLRLQVNVKRNQQPVFISPPQTQFTLRFGDYLIYRLPETVDPDGNAEAQITVRPFTGFVDKFPPFISIFNGNRTFEFDVDKEEYAGNEFFFKIILKEKSGLAVGLPFYFTIFVEPIPPGPDVGEDNGSMNGGGGGDMNGGNDGSSTNNGSDGSSTNDGNGSSNEGGSSSGGSPSGGGNGQGSQDGNTGGQGINDALVKGIKRTGSVLRTDKFEEKEDNELKLIELYTTSMSGSTQIKFLQQTDMAQIEEDIDQLFQFDVLSYKQINETNQNVQVTDYQFSNFNASNQTIDVKFKFDEPFRLGLNTEKSDYLIVALNNSYPWTEIMNKEARMLQDKELQQEARARIELIFDYDNEQMKRIVTVSEVFFYIFVFFLFLQVVALLFQNVGLITFWVMIDYSQLIAYLPLMFSRCVPLVYEFFRPFLVTHNLFKYPGDPGVDSLVYSEYLNLSFRSYSIRQDDLLYMSALTWILILVLIIVFDVVVSIAVKSSQCCSEGCMHKLLVRLQLQFRYNIYIRYLMVVYLDMVFITGILIADDVKAEGTDLQWTSFMAYLILAVAAFIPFMVMIYLCAKFDTLKEKAGKEQFNTLLLKIDKEDRWRIFLPSFYFFRRFAIGVVLVLGSKEEAPAYLQFVVLISCSALKIFYLAKTEPYIQRRYNSYVTCMELIYFMLGMAIFTFTDASDDVNLKMSMTYVCLILLCLFFILNIIMSIYFICQGRENLRTKDLEAKQFRHQKLEKTFNEKAKRKEKHKRKKQRELDKAENDRKVELETKREKMRELGYTEDEINTKLPLEPVQETGFKFGGVMGKRLVDYGIMSSSSDSEAEDDSIITQTKPGSKQSPGMEMINIKHIRNESKAVPVMDFDDQDLGELRIAKTSTFGRANMETDLGGILETDGRLETEAPFDLRSDQYRNEPQLVPQRRIFGTQRSNDTRNDTSITGQTRDNTNNDFWMERPLYTRSVQGRREQSFARQPSSSQVDFDDDYDGENLASDRRLIADASGRIITDTSVNDGNMFTLDRRQHDRSRIQDIDDYSPERDGNPVFHTQLNNTAELSSRQGILDTEQKRNEERLQRLAEDLQSARSDT